MKADELINKNYSVKKEVRDNDKFRTKKSKNNRRYY